MKEILVNIEGYNQFFDEFEKLNNSLTSNAAHGSEVYADAVGDGWHDNFAYEDAMRKEKMIRFISIFSVLSWLVYNIVSGAYGSAVGSVLTLVSIISALIRYRSKKSAT